MPPADDHCCRRAGLDVARGPRPIRKAGQYDDVDFGGPALDLRDNGGGGVAQDPGVGLHGDELEAHFDLAPRRGAVPLCRPTGFPAARQAAMIFSKALSTTSFSVIQPRALPQRVGKIVGADVDGVDALVPTISSTRSRPSAVSTMAMRMISSLALSV